MAHTRDALYMTAGKMELNVNGELRKMEVSEVALLTDDMAEEMLGESCATATLFGLLTSIGVVFPDLFVLVGLLAVNGSRTTNCAGPSWWKERACATDPTPRRASPYEIAGVPMRVKSETLHTLFAGAQGTGKSQQFFALMKQVRARGKRMIVYMTRPASSPRRSTVKAKTS